MALGNCEPKLRGNVGNSDVGHMTHCVYVVFTQQLELVRMFEI